MRPPYHNLPQELDDQAFCHTFKVCSEHNLFAHAYLLITDKSNLNWAICKSGSGSFRLRALQMVGIRNRKKKSSNELLFYILKIIKIVQWMICPFQLRDCYFLEIFYIIRPIIYQQMDGKKLDTNPK